MEPLDLPIRLAIVLKLTHAFERGDNGGSV